MSTKKEVAQNVLDTLLPEETTATTTASNGYALAADDIYTEAINEIEAIGKKQQKAIDDYVTAQKKNQEKALGITLDKLDKSINEAEADYNKEQSAAYADWKKQSDPYGVNAEKIAGAGMSGSGYSESSQVRMYSAYQNRVAVARESYNRAIADYNIAIEEAKNQNSSLMAEITYNALIQSLELAMEILTKKTSLMKDSANGNLSVYGNGTTGTQTGDTSVVTDPTALSGGQSYAPAPSEVSTPFGAGSALFPYWWEQQK